MSRPPPFLRLPNDLLREILDHVDPDADKLLTIDRREYLSRESFKTPSPPDRDQARYISLFRLICKRFAELGAIHQFARVTTRFSLDGFARLEKIATSSNVAHHVKKFSYLVPYFYEEGREFPPETIQGSHAGLGTLNITSFSRKLKAQRYIIRSGEDRRVLKRAISAFTSLQHIQILAVQDEEDGLLINYMRDHQELTRLIELKWEPACSHSSKTIAAALLASSSPLCKFSSPMLSSQSAMALARQGSQTIRALAQSLTSLELHFIDGSDVGFDDRMLELSSLFYRVFTAAENMQTIHIGFPQHRPLSLPLEKIFHGIKWERLSCFGIQAWKLTAEEIIGIAQRHRDRLRGLRLRHVLLKDGSRWDEVLPYLRDDMPRLDWASLRCIGYAKEFDEHWAAAGVEVPDDPPGGGSDSDEDGAFTDDGNVSIGEESAENEMRESDTDEEMDHEHGPHTIDMAFPHLSLNTQSSVPRCNCDEKNSYLAGPEALGDDGISVSYLQWKTWEKWVVRKCAEHPST